MAATIELTAAERAAGRLSPDQLDAAVAAMEADGFVLLVNAIDVATIDRLGEKMRADMAEVARSRPIGELATNESLTPPVNHPWLFEEICFNPFALQVPRLPPPALPPCQACRSATRALGGERHSLVAHAALVETVKQRWGHRCLRACWVPASTGTCTARTPSSPTRRAPKGCTRTRTPCSRRRSCTPTHRPPPCAWSTSR